MFAVVTYELHASRELLSERGPHFLSFLRVIDLDCRIEVYYSAVVQELDATRKKDGEVGRARRTSSRSSSQYPVKHKKPRYFPFLYR